MDTLSPFGSVSAPAMPGLAARLFRIPKPKLAEQQICHLLGLRSPFDISESIVAEAFHQFHCRGQRARDVAMRIWSRALESFLSDNRLSDDELAYLDRLSRLLDIGCDDVEQIKQRLLYPRYQAAVRTAVSDGVISTDEHRFLDALQAGLRLPAHVAYKLRESPTREVVTAKLGEIMARHRVTPDDHEALARLESDLGTTLNLDADTERQLARFSHLWKIENGGLPVVNAPIALLKAETCHFLAPCQWWETRSRTTRINYHGPVLSIPIVKGFRYRVGSFAPQRITKEELTRLDTGTVYFTNKRVIFVGAIRNFAIRLSSLLGIKAFSDAIALEKATGRSPHLLLPDGTDVEAACVILSALLANA